MSVPMQVGLIEHEPAVCQHCRKLPRFCRCKDEENESTYWLQQLSEDEERELCEWLEAVDEGI